MKITDILKINSELAELQTAPKIGWRLIERGEAVSCDWLRYQQAFEHKLPAVVRDAIEAQISAVWRRAYRAVIIETAAAR